jgi:hypothetical protein
MNPILTQANAILACPHLQWNEQARQLIPVIEGLVKEAHSSEQLATDKRNLMNEALYYRAALREIADMEPLLTSYVRAALNYSVPTTTPATSGTHQPDSVTGDALVAGGSFICPFCQKPSPGQFPHAECIYRERARDEN